MLRPENENLQIRESDTGVFVAGVHETEVKGMEDCLHLLQLGERNRCTDRMPKHVPLQSAHTSSIYPQCLQRHINMPRTNCCEKALHEKWCAYLNSACICFHCCELTAGVS